MTRRVSFGRDHTGCGQSRLCDWPGPVTETARTMGFASRGRIEGIPSPGSQVVRRGLMKLRREGPQIPVVYEFQPHLLP